MRSNSVSTLLLATLLFAALALVGCNDNENGPASSAVSDEQVQTVPAEVLDELAELRRLAALEDHGVSEILAEDQTDSPPVYVPAGSVNALQAAIAAAGNNGKVILRSGMHTESTMVTITQRVTLVGENGAVLRSAVQPSAELPTTVIDPAIYVHGAERVKIWNIDFRPTGTVGGTAILLENSPRTTVACNSMEEFQEGILLHNSHSSTISGNRIVASDAWTTGGLPECDGVININGRDVCIADNDLSDGLFNIFCSGASGFCIDNTMRNGFVSLILCKIPAGGFRLPSGAIVGSEISARNWFVEDNVGTGNLYAGFLVIDGANNNRLEDNRGSGNGVYDLELLGTTCLFGFQTPTSFNNTVVVGSRRNMTINDFGTNNRIIGRVTVTHNVSAPCP